MWKFVISVLVVLLVAVFGFSLIDGGDGDVNADAIVQAPDADSAGFARAFEPREWVFPRDHGAHPQYQTEWWYYTGNLAAEDGRRFGFQFTIFRRALTAETLTSDTAWRTGQIYMAHFSLSDIEGEAFYHDERYSRGGAELAGALPDPAQPDAGYRVWLEDWQAYALNDDATLQRIVADAGDFAVDLQLEQAKPYVLQGNQGLSPKSDEPGNASYYYSLPRLLTDGTIRIGEQTFAVEGTAWMDQEFSTSALGDGALGWDWFAFHFDDGRELVIGQIRLADGGIEPSYTGTMIYEDGSYQKLASDEYVIETTGEWTSPHTGAVYPSGWVITIDAAVVRDADDLEIIVTPLARDQELHSGDIAYWEGAVALSGGVTGYGYAELTGYTEVMTGRF